MLKIDEVKKIFSLSVKEYKEKSACCTSIKQWLQIPVDGIPSRVVIACSKRFDIKKSAKYQNKKKNNERARRPINPTVYLSVRDRVRLAEKENKEFNLF